ncbi:MAG: hypothetical protein J2P40_16535 [Candidatus Dormibacteraeota bacterium]|nr:hypothetical protein [Candidatus Dormibacteraeota bacterium]MBO0762883.1 hypothetical protein [Candidatus Dormibacteraeota bacterium]
MAGERPAPAARLSRERQLELLRSARAIVAELQTGCDTPAVFQACKSVEMHLHWAAWLLGSVDEVLPELET